MKKLSFRPENCKSNLKGAKLPLGLTLSVQLSETVNLCGFITTNHPFHINIVMRSIVTPEIVIMVAVKSLMLLLQIASVF